MNNNSQVVQTENSPDGAVSRVTLPARIERTAEAISRGFNLIACLGILGMLGLATVDLIGNKLGHWRFAGAFEVIGMLGLITIVFAIPHTQVNHGHTAVDFVYVLLPKRAKRVVDAIIPLFGLGIFSFMSWQMYALGLRLQTQGAVSVTEGIPTAPFAYATAVCCLIMCLVLIVQCVKAVRGVVKWKTMS